MMLSPIQLVETEEARQASNTLLQILGAWGNGGTSAASTLGSAELWAKLSNGGWPFFAGGFDGQPQPHLRDIVAFGEVCGRKLLALPLLQTALVVRWSEPSDDDLVSGEPFTFGIPTPEALIIPFGQTNNCVLYGKTGHRRVRPIRNVGSVDKLSDTLPLQYTPPDGEAYLTAAQAREAAIVHAASAVGAADECLQRTISYSRARVVYGKPIGSYQAVRHIIVDMYRDLELARSGVVGAIHEHNWLQILTVCLETVQRVVARSIQVHGGIGFTWEMGLHFYARHILATRKLIRSLGTQQNR
jgi:hypothetical protein